MGIESEIFLTAVSFFCPPLALAQLKLPDGRSGGREGKGGRECVERWRRGQVRDGSHQGRVQGTEEFTRRRARRAVVSGVFSLFFCFVRRTSDPLFSRLTVAFSNSNSVASLCLSLVAAGRHVAPRLHERFAFSTRSVAAADTFSSDREKREAKPPECAGSPGKCRTPAIATPTITPGVAASLLFVDVSRSPFQLTFLVFYSSNILQVGQIRPREQRDVMDVAVACPAPGRGGGRGAWGPLKWWPPRPRNYIAHKT